MTTHVYLKLYKPTQLPFLHKMMRKIGIPFYHSSVIVNDNEYSFMGHSDDWSGIIDSSKDKRFELSSVVPVGKTVFSQQYIDRVIEEYDRLFKGSAYHLFNFNCHTFTEMFINELLDQTPTFQLPFFITRLQRIFNPFQIMLPNFLLMPEKIEYTFKTEYAYDSSSAPLLGISESDMDLDIYTYDDYSESSQLTEADKHTDRVLTMQQSLEKLQAQFDNVEMDKTDLIAKLLSKTYDNPSSSEYYDYDSLLSDLSSDGTDASDKVDLFLPMVVKTET
ncbi:hypothetical protein PCE1_002724 [Barthelona sp. PCE]